MNLQIIVAGGNYMDYMELSLRDKYLMWKTLRLREKKESLEKRKSNSRFFRWKLNRLQKRLDKCERKLRFKFLISGVYSEYCYRHYGKSYYAPAINESWDYFSPSSSCAKH